MKNIIEQIDRSKLLVGKVLNSLNEEEKTDDKEVVDDILNYSDFSEWQENLNDLDTKEEWNVFLSQMQSASKRRNEVRRLKVLKWMSGVAAIFIVGFLASNFFKSSGDSFNSIDESNIVPGSAHAELILSSGEVINLEDTKHKKLNEGGIALENDKGVLQYKNGDNNGKVEEERTNILKVPRGAEYQLELPDGTKVWLNSDTKLAYTIPFTGGERKVTLKGEAYFEVARNEDLPFIVSTEGQDITVLGTQFNVSAYGNEIMTTTTLVEGKVLVADKNSSNKEFLLPNEQSLFNRNTNNLQKKPVDVYPFIAWKEGRFVFNNVSLETFLSKVARWYDVEILFDDESLKNLSFTGDLPRYSNMKNILRIIELETSVNIKVENNKKIHVYK